MTRRHIRRMNKTERKELMNEGYVGHITKANTQLKPMKASKDI